MCLLILSLLLYTQPKKIKNILVMNCKLRTTSQKLKIILTSDKNTFYSEYNEMLISYGSSYGKIFNKPGTIF